MKLSGSRLYVLLLAVMTFAVGVVTNVATNQMPTWLQPYLWLSWPILGVLFVLFIVLSVYHVHQESPLPPRLSESEPQPRERMSDRKALRCYLEQLIEEHKYFTFLGRAKPLDLERIYIALKVGEYVPRQLQPDELIQTEGDELPQQRSGTVELPEALRLHRRLAVLGEPGSGKTTLLKYLSLLITKRDPALAKFARKMVPQSLARWADDIYRRLSESHWSLDRFGFLFGFVATAVWIWGLFHSPHLLLAVLIGLVLAVMVYFFLQWSSSSFTWVLTVVSVGLLLYCGLAGIVPLLAVGAMAVTLILSLFDCWIKPPLAALKWLRQHWTCYPIPLYLTLNNLAGIEEPLEAHLTRALGETGFAHPQRFLEQKLERGECIILLDALDEVVDETVYHRAAREINRLAVKYHRNQIIVTCRIAGFRGFLKGFLQLEVQDFNEKQVTLFLRNWFGDSPPEEQESRVDGLLRCLRRSDRMRLLAANPLFLSIISLLYELNFTLPERRVELYEECSQVLLEKGEIEKGLYIKGRFPPEKKVKALQSIATHFHQKGARIFTEEALLTALEGILPSLGYPGMRNKEFLQEIMERSGLLRQKSRTSYDFAHLTFQEFFTAKEFHGRADAESLLRHLDDPWWREVVLLYVGLEDDATLLLEQLRKHEVLLAAAALADARPVNTYAFEWVAHKIIKQLRHLMEHDPRLRQGAADALAGISRWGTTEYLVQKALVGGRPLVAVAAILALVRAADRSVLDRLFNPPEPIVRLLQTTYEEADHHWKKEKERVNKNVKERIATLLKNPGLLERGGNPGSSGRNMLLPKPSGFPMPMV